MKDSSLIVYVVIPISLFLNHVCFEDRVVTPPPHSGLLSKPLCVCGVGGGGGRKITKLKE